MRNNSEIDNYFLSSCWCLCCHILLVPSSCLRVTAIFYKLPFISIASVSVYMNDPKGQTFTVFDW